MDWLSTIILGFFGTALFGVPYFFFIAQREQELRTLLKAQRRRRVQRKYVRALVAAVRGEGEVEKARLLSGFRVLFSATVAILVLGYALHLGSDHAEIQARVADLEELVNQDASTEAETDSPDDPVSKARSFLEEARDLERSLARVKIAAWGIGLVAYAWYFWRSMVWQPFALLRSRFSWEVTRATRTLQSLAGKKELAQLASLETEVRDEKTLRRFVEEVRVLSKRHAVPELASAFDLWSE